MRRLAAAPLPGARAGRLDRRLRTALVAAAAGRRRRPTRPPRRRRPRPDAAAGLRATAPAQPAPALAASPTAKSSPAGVASAALHRPLPGAGPARRPCRAAHISGRRRAATPRLGGRRRPRRRRSGRRAPRRLRRVRAAPSRWSLSAWLLVRRRARRAGAGRRRDCWAAARPARALTYRLGRRPARPLALRAPIRRCGARPAPRRRSGSTGSRRRAAGQPARRAAAGARARRAARPSRSPSMAASATLRSAACGSTPMPRPGSSAPARATCSSTASLRVSLPLGAGRVGAGAWAARPARRRRGSMSARSLPTGCPSRGRDVTLAADWRFRVAGDAAPRLRPRADPRRRILRRRSPSARAAFSG